MRREKGERAREERERREREREREYNHNTCPKHLQNIHNTK